MTPLPDPRSERAELEGRLHDEGWASKVNVEGLLAAWERLAGEVDDYRLEIEDYTNDLTSRDALELLIGWASADFGLELLERVEPADERFRSVTVEDDGEAVGRHFDIDEDAGWWWRRRPTSGPLASYLDERS